MNSNSKMNPKVKLVFGLSILTYFQQGVEGLPAQGLFVFMKTKLGMTPQAIMWFGTFIGIAWLIKPVLGAIIDRFFGKKWWYFGAVLLSMVTCAFLAKLSLPIIFLGCLLALLSTAASIRDISVDGIAVCAGKANGICDKLQSVQWIAVTVGSLLVGIGGGYIAQYLPYQVGFMILIPIYALAGCLILKYKPEAEQTKVTFGSVLVLFKDKRFILTCLFIFLYKYSPSFGTPLGFIIRDKFKWSEIFIGFLGTITAVMSIIGALIYYRISKKIDPKKWITISIWLGAITTLLYLYYTRYTAVGYDVVFSLTGMFFHLIIMSWMAENSVTGLETTSFATLCAISNLAGTAGSASGAWLLPIIGLPGLIILSAATSFLCLPLAPIIFRKNNE
jgi:predicted MFS family arabinose efflux permease